MRRRSRASSRKLVRKTSAPATRRSSRARPSACPRSVPTLRLLRPRCSTKKLRPEAPGISPEVTSPRMGSPKRGCSIFTISAPQSPRTVAADGTKPQSATSITRTPARTSAMAASVQMIELGRVRAGDEASLLVGHVLEVLDENLARLRPGAVRVRIVGRPHDVVEPGAVTLGDAGEVLDEGGVSLAVPVRARLLGEDRLGPEAVLVERLVHALDEVRYPADAALDQHELELGVAGQDAGEDQRGDGLADRHRGDGDERLLDPRRRVLEGRLDVGVARSDDVEADRQAGLLDHRPERLVGLVPERLTPALVRERVAMEAPQAELRDAGELLHGLVEVDERDVREPDQPVRRRLRQLDHPVVVALDDVATERRVLGIARDRAAEVEYLGVDAVEVHVLEARLGIVRPGTHVLVAETEGLEVLGLAAGGGVEADRAADLRVDDPEVALVGGFDPRHPVLHAVGGPARPEILRRVHVRIRRDDALAGHRSILLLVADDEERFSVARAFGSSDRSILRRSSFLTRHRRPSGCCGSHWRSAWQYPLRSCRPPW